MLFSPKRLFSSLINLFYLLIIEDFYYFLDYWFYHQPKNFFRQALERIYITQHDLGFKKNLRTLFKPFYFFPLKFIYLSFLSLIYLFYLTVSLIFILALTFLPVSLLILALPRNEILLGK
ncbi:hypothetical protein HRbin35_00512 [bacterium HR35]|nr:hypothetical protein HRbin35_00512 [bacterium HR35]